MIKRYRKLILQLGRPRLRDVVATASSRAILAPTCYLIQIDALGSIMDSLEDPEGLEGMEAAEAAGRT